MRITGLIFLLCLFGFSGSAKAADVKSIDLKIDDYARNYVYHLPPHHDVALPVMLVLADAGSDGETALKRYKWNDLADSDGFIAVGLTPLPVDPAKAEMFQTNPSIWSDGSGRGNAKRGQLDDVAYVRAVLDDLGDRVKLDSKRIYATGFGNGGSMTHLLGLKLSDKLAAIAPVEGHSWSADTPKKQIPVMMLFGAKDPIEPIAGGMGINPWTNQPEQRPATRDSADRWVKNLACTDAPATSTILAKAQDTAWTKCAGGSSVDYVVIPDLGHHWPGGGDDMMPSFGLTNDDFAATPFLWNWFKQRVKS